MKPNAKQFCFLVLMGILFSSIAFAQGTTATLNGVVSDPAGAAISGAQVEIQNVGTNFTQAVETNDSGLYSVSQLIPGEYKVTVEKTGFQKSVQTGITLTVGQVGTLNIALEVGDVKETVTVTANAELINVTTADMSSVVDQASVEELPLNGRDPSSLVLLTTGSTNVLNTSGGWLQTSNSFPDETGASSGGGRQGSTYYLLDGASNMDSYQLLAAPFPNADATQEFRVITTNFDAQYGFSPNAVVSIQTKSGSNAFHGGAFEFIRNNDLNAANYFSHAVDPLKRNQFGGYVGGPIRKDKLFFFTNYQATRASSAASANNTYTPTEAMLNGDFSAVPTTLGGPFATVNGKPNQVSPALFSKAAYTIATTALPLGQDPATGQVNYLGPSIQTKYDEGTARIDYNINDKQRLFLRSFIQDYRQIGGSTKGNLMAIQDTQPGEYYNEVLNHNWMINPSTVNSLTLFYSQMSIQDSAQSLDASGTPVCWSRYIDVNELPGECYMEGLTVNNGFSSQWDEPVAERRYTWGLSDQVIKTMSKHTVSAGVDLHKQFAQENTGYPTQPIITFNGQYTGFGLADYLLGYVSTYEQGAGEIASVKGWQFGLYAQDQYRLNSSLTLTAGLRWDPNLPPSSTGGRGAAFHPGQQSTMYPNAPLGVVFPGDQGVDSALMPTSYGYWEPRIGFSWQPHNFPNTAVRGGFGLFTGPMPYASYNHMADLAPFSPTFILNGDTPNVINGVQTNAINLQEPWAATPSGVSPFPPFASLNYKPPTNTQFQTPMDLPATFSNNFRLGMTQSWSLSVEQQLMQNLALHVAYIGSQSYHQAIIVDRNPGVNNVRTEYGPGGVGQLLTDESVGNSSYHSLQISVDKRMSHGFQIKSNFTWSKVLDLSSNGDISDGGTYPGVTNPFNLEYNRGISDLNVPLISTTNFIYTSSPLQGWNPVLRNILGAWEISAIYTLQSGQPFSISGGDGDNNSGALQYRDRADFVSGVSPEVHSGGRSNWLNHYVNHAAFQPNAIGTFGDTGRNIYTDPHINTADSALMKNWRIQDRYGIQFRWEMFNTFNHTSFGTPNTDATPSNGSFGQITSIGPIAPRVMQGGLKFSF
jgi:Carboxypeptidase regulatory-like domain